MTRYILRAAFKSDGTPYRKIFRLEGSELDRMFTAAQRAVLERGDGMSVPVLGHVYTYTDLEAFWLKHQPAQVSA